MEREHGLTSYFTLLQLFVAGMVGVVLVTNLFLFYIFWGADADTIIRADRLLGARATQDS
jgi:hypothetical protein